MKYNTYIIMNGTDETASLYVNANPDNNKKNNIIIYGIVHRANKLAMCLIKFIMC